MEISKDANINYLAKIVKIGNVVPIEKTDNLAIVVVDGNSVVVNKNTVKSGNVMVFFPAESTISDWFLSNNNLYRDKTLNKDPEKYGFFEKNGRVRCIKLLGNISSGFLAHFDNLGVPFFSQDLIGKEFDKIGDQIIIKKYINKVQRTPGAPNSNKTRKGKIISKVIETQFRFHIDTPQFVKNIHRFDENTEFSISRKIHGTSGISSYVLCNKENSWHSKLAAWVWNNIWDKIINLFSNTKYNFELTKTKYDYLYSSRRVVKNDRVETGFYKVDIWKLADEIIKPYLIKGMSVYYEIVGYLPDGGMIQKDYSYGMVPPSKDKVYEFGKNFDIYIYRITLTNEDGIVTEWNDKMVGQYCKKIGIKQVPVYYVGNVKDFLARSIDNDLVVGQINNKVLDRIETLSKTEPIDKLREFFLNKLTSTYLEKIAKDCGKNIPDEGIVLRINSLDLDVYKLKSKNFLLKETKEIDSGEINIEDEVE